MFGRWRPHSQSHTQSSDQSIVFPTRRNKNNTRPTDLMKNQRLRSLEPDPKVKDVGIPFLWRRSKWDANYDLLICWRISHMTLINWWYIAPSEANNTILFGHPFISIHHWQLASLSKTVSTIFPHSYSQMWSELWISIITFSAFCP